MVRDFEKFARRYPKWRQEAGPNIVRNRFKEHGLLAHDKTIKKRRIDDEGKYRFFNYTEIVDWNMWKEIVAKRLDYTTKEEVATENEEEPNF